MRLIDTDKIDFNEVFVGASKFAEDTRQAGKMLIDAQPTAYDVDKVIEELKEMGNEYCKSVKCNGECDCCEHASMMQSAIKIVKGGGIDGR